jgi:uncharacterized protein (UPF0276 family)
VGINYQKSYASILSEHSDLVDFLEFNPDALCSWQQRSGQWQLLRNPSLYQNFLQIRQQLPVTVHGLSLSIGSASGWNESYLAILDEMQSEVPFYWHSEHVGFLDVVTPDGEYLHAGTQLPMPFTYEALELLVPRVQRMIEHYQRPFLLENTTYYFPGIASDGMDEVNFLNALCLRSGERCGLLLDLYNFYCNAENFAFDPYTALEKLDMSRVVEIHIAGGSQHKGFHLDVHSNHTPEPVWDLLQWVLARAPNVKAVVYELLEQALDAVTEAGVCRNLERARHHWNQSREAIYNQQKIGALA